MTATFGKKNSGAPASFGKRSTPAAGLMGSRPAAASASLSPEAQAFLAAERQRSGAAATPSAPAQSYAVPSNGSSLPGGKPVFWRRIIAKIIDEVLVWGLVVLISGGALAALAGTYLEADTGSPEEAAAGADMMIYVLVFMVVSLAYSVGMQASSLQATLGKMAMGIIVTDKHGDRPGMGKILFRETLGRSLANLMPFYSGYAMGMFNKDKKCVHDMVAGTIVCTKESSTAGYAEAFA
ncbi:MAG: RDD family protein [Hyphomonas sp.]|nr:RDD family protein [Hyphomonas sp.]